MIASTKDLSRKILNSPTFVQPCVVDAGKKILMATNWVFLDGKAHVEYRKGLNVLFTRKSLATYIPEQMKVYDTYFKACLAKSEEGPVPYMHIFRDLNTAVSCRTFFGYWIEDSQIKQISDDYWYITAAMELVNFPIALPYTKVWYGIQARKTVMKAFEAASAKSRKAMLAGAEPVCMVDAWIKAMLDAQKFSKSGADKADMTAPVLIRDFSDSEIGRPCFLSCLHLKMPLRPPCVGCSSFFVTTRTSMPKSVRSSWRFVEATRMLKLTWTWPRRWSSQKQWSRRPCVFVLPC